MTSSTLPRFSISTLVAPTVAAAALASSALANAAPEWDVAAWDQCVAPFDGNPNSSQAEYERWVDHLKYCCEKTGGVFTGPGPGSCVAPPADAAESQPGSQWRPPAGSIPTLMLTPDPDNPATVPQQGAVG